MSKRDSSFYIVDIFIAIFQIEQYTKNISDAEEFRWSTINWDATLRQLEIIGEATRYLINMNTLDNKKYRKIVDFRNVIIHGYFGIDEEEVWYVIKHKLKAFSSELYQIIDDNNIDISDAVDFSKKENIKNGLLVEFLGKLA